MGHLAGRVLGGSQGGGDLKVTIIYQISDMRYKISYIRYKISDMIYQMKGEDSPSHR